MRWTPSRSPTPSGGSAVRSARSSAWSARLEQLQVPLAQVRGALGIPGMDEETALNVRDKSRMKSVLRSAGIPCARHQLVTRTEEATSFLAEVGLPMVAKPPAGAGAQATYRLDTEADFASWLRAAQADPAEVWLLEEFLTGPEHTFDSVTIDGNTVWASISDYQPPPLEVLRTPWVQWTVVLPRAIDAPEYDAIKQVGPAALRALGVQTAFTHMEWFERPDGSVAVSEVGARPPGAQLASMIGFSHDFDFYSSVGRTGAARPVRPTRPRVRHRHGLPARAGPRPGPRGARRGGDAARAGSPGRRREAPATRAAGLHLVRGRRVRHRPP